MNSVTHRQYEISTSHGVLAVEEHCQGELPVVFIHGNSTCRSVFRRQITADLLQGRRFIMFDLPGHGASSDALDPQLTYTRPGLAAATLELLQAIDATEAVLVGWSLGGHIAVELAPHLPTLRGLLISGAPPVANGHFRDGFKGALAGGLPGQRSFDAADVQDFAHHVFGDLTNTEILAAVARADGRFRERLFQAAREGVGVDQRRVVEGLSVPLAVVNGAQDPIVNLDYFDSISYENLFCKKCFRIEDAKHAPFLESPYYFNALLAAFLNTIRI